MKTSSFAFLAAQLVLAACNGGTSAPASAPSEPSSEPPSASPTSELPPGHPPITGEAHAPSQPGSPHAGPAQAGPAPTGAASAGGLTWRHEEPLVRRAPKSSMRAAEYGLSGDAQAELTVFYFGPDQGGSVDANVTRWLGQLTQPDGSDGASKQKRSTRTVSGLPVTLVETTGRYSGGMAMPGAGGGSAIEDAMLLGAIASGPQGPVFFKLVGPRASVEQARGAFDALIGSLSPQ